MNKYIKRAFDELDMESGAKMERIIALQKRVKQDREKIKLLFDETREIKEAMELLKSLEEENETI